MSLAPEVLVIANRSSARAQLLAKEFAELGKCGAASSPDRAPAFDLVVNATSASLRGEVALIPIDVVDYRNTCYDMGYGVGDTPFVTWAKRLGAPPGRAGLGDARPSRPRGFSAVARVRPDTRRCSRCCGCAPLRLLVNPA